MEIVSAHGIDIENQHEFVECKNDSYPIRAELAVATEDSPANVQESQDHETNDSVQACRTVDEDHESVLSAAGSQGMEFCPIHLEECFCLKSFRHKGSRVPCNSINRYLNCLRLRYPFCSCVQSRSCSSLEKLLVLSIIQILCGAASVLLSCVAFAKTVFLYRVAAGSWAGFSMFITGMLGVITTRRMNMCTMIALLVCCVITASTSCVVISLSVAGVVKDGFYRDAYLKYGLFLDILRQKLTDAITYAYVKSGVDHPSFNNTHSLSFRDSLTDRFVSLSYDSHLRACQVTLHVVLLLIALCDFAVALFTSVLCCRYIHRSCRLGSMSNITSRTNIVSLNSATASQAAAVLRSGNVNQFVGTGNLLLAVESDHLLHGGYTSVDRASNTSLITPHIHHTARSFIPNFNRSALILTQAGAGTMAWTAARAAATLLDRNSREVHNVSQDIQERVPIHGARVFANRRLNLLRRRCKQPRLRFTSLRTSSLQRNNVSQDPLSNLCNPDSLSFPPGSTLLYVVPSPSREEPPTIFPPFPPTYSSSHRRPILTNFPRLRRRDLSSHFSIEPENGVDRVINSYQRSLLNTPRPRPSGRRQNARNRVRRSVPGPRTSASSLMCAVDRLMQPVLIIEDPVACADSIDPPEYSVLDPNLSPKPVE